MAAREHLRRSARAIAVAASSRVATPAGSDDSDLELLGLGDDDSEDEYVEGGGKGGGEASGSESGSEGAVEEEEDDEVDEESDIDDDGKGKKGKGKGKGKDKAIATPRGAQKRKRSALSATPATPATPRGRGAAASARKARASVPGRRSTAAALSNSTLNVFPPTYRDLLLDSALSLVRKSDADKPAFQPPRPPVFPPGPVTPFLSRLAADPETPDSEGVQRAEVVPDDPHGPDRRDHMRDLAKRVGIVPPWDGWEGEGWWPDMVRELRETEHEVEEKGKGKGKAKGKGAASEAPDGPVPGWKWRADVRLGLDDIGRCSPSDVLSKSDGATYLQTGSPVVLNIYDGTNTARHELPALSAISINTTISTGFALAAGAPVWGLDWCPFPDAASSSHYEQFVAVSTIPGMTPVTGARCDRRTRAAIQVWAVPPAGLARCELVLCVEGGPVSDLKWMPMGAWDASSERGLPKLGILAAVHLDGSTALYAVPQPAALRVATPTVASASDPIFLRAAPLARFAVDDAACTCIEWLSGRRLAAGLANGHLVVWDAVSALLGNNDDGGDPLPDMYLTLALSSIRSIAAGRCPPTDAHGALDYAGESVYLAFGSYDGTAGVVDLREPGTVLELNRSRLPCMATAWSSQVGVPLYADVDYMVLLAQLRANIGPATYYLAPHRGPVWSIGTSDYHTTVASAASDGSLLLSNCGMGFYRRKQGGMLFQRLYELDVDESTSAVRLAHGFAPEASGLEEATSKAGHKNGSRKGAGGRADALAPADGDPVTVKTGAWRPSVGVHRATWQTGAGLSRAGWLASAGAAGLVRVDNVQGKWLS